MKKSNWKRFIALTMSSMMLMGLTAYGDTNAAEEHTEEVNLTFWAFSKWAGVTGKEPDGQMGDWEKAMAEEFMEMHPNVTIEVEVFDNTSGGGDKARAAIAAPAAPATFPQTATVAACNKIVDSNIMLCFSYY